MARTILIIDDEAIVRDVSKMSLVRAGFDVLAAADGQAGLAILESQPSAIDAVLLDLTMPGVSGEEVFRGLRARRPELPVIVTSGYSEEVMAERLHDPQGTCYLQKPFSPRLVIEKLRDVFGLTPV